MAKLPSRPTGFLALFATFLVVGGVAAVAFVAAPRTPSGQDQKPVPEAQKKASPYFPPFLAVDASVRLITDTAERTLAWPDDVKVLGQPLSTVRGVDVGTGEVAVLENGFVRSTSTAVRSPDGRRSAQSATHRQDATSSIEVRYGNESRSYVLRLSNGSGVRDAKPVGWWDDDTVAVFGLTTSTRDVYALDLTGTVRRVAQLPEFIEHVRVEDGAVWYVRVTPGEGLEQPAMPPTELHRVTPDGRDEAVVSESGEVITGYAILTPALLAYQTEKGGAVLVSDGKAVSLGKGMPLLFLNEEHLLIMRDGAVFMRHLDENAETPIPSITGPSAVFTLLRADIDETPKNP